MAAVCTPLEASLKQSLPHNQKAENGQNKSKAVWFDSVQNYFDEWLLATHLFWFHLLEIGEK